MCWLLGQNSVEDEEECIFLFSLASLHQMLKNTLVRLLDYMRSCLACERVSLVLTFLCLSQLVYIIDVDIILQIFGIMTLYLPHNI